jgi:hypothetical protein
MLRVSWRVGRRVQRRVRRRGSCGGHHAETERRSRCILQASTLTAFVPPAASRRQDPARSATRASRGNAAWWGPSSGTPTAEPVVPRSAETPGPRVSTCLPQASTGVTRRRCARGDEHYRSWRVGRRARRRGSCGGHHAETERRYPCTLHATTVAAFVPPAAPRRRDPARSATRAPHGSGAWWGPSSGPPTAEHVAPRGAGPDVRRIAETRLTSSPSRASRRARASSPSRASRPSRASWRRVARAPRASRARLGACPRR